jgi:hypothetical protein
MTRLYTLILFSTLAVCSCKTASKAYQKGDYTDAIELGVKKLQKDPNDTETRDLVRQSYTYMVAAHEDRIRVLSNSKSDTRFENIYSEYAALQHLYDAIHQYPAVAQQIEARDYSEFVATYRDKAADVHQDKADKWMDEGTKDAYRQAYKEFNVALRYRPDDAELRRKRDDAYNSALTRVVIAPMQSYSGYQYGSSYQLQNFQRDIIRTLANSMNNDFVRFYTEYEARTQNIEPDQILELSLNRITIGQPYDDRSSREVSKQVVVKETVFKKDSVVKEYATVKARITTTKRTLLSQGELFITVRDTRGRVIWSDRFTGEHRWQSEFTTYTGDERALSDNDKKSLNQRDYTAPTEEQIMNELMREIQSDLSSRLQGYYRSRI